MGTMKSVFVQWGVHDFQGKTGMHRCRNDAHFNSDFKRFNDLLLCCTVLYCLFHVPLHAGLTVSDYSNRKGHQLLVLLWEGIIRECCLLNFHGGVVDFGVKPQAFPCAHFRWRVSWFTLSWATSPRVVILRDSLFNVFFVLHLMYYTYPCRRADLTAFRSSYWKVHPTFRNRYAFPHKEYKSWCIRMHICDFTCFGAWLDTLASDLLASLRIEKIWFATCRAIDINFRNRILWKWIVLFHNLPDSSNHSSPLKRCTRHGAEIRGVGGCTAEGLLTPLAGLGMVGVHWRLPSRVIT